MATVTLGANTNYSTLTVNNGDTIALAGYTLTLDVAPAQTNVTVTTTGTNGRIALGSPTSYTFTGWSFTAGTTSLFTSVPSGTTFTGGTYTGGSSYAAGAIGTLSGTVTGATIIAGSTYGAQGIVTVQGTVTSCTVQGNSSEGGIGTVTTSGVLNNCTVAGGNNGGINSHQGVFDGGSISGGTNGSGIQNCSGVVKNATITSAPAGSSTNAGISYCTGPLTNCIISATSGSNKCGVTTANGVVTGCTVTGGGSANNHGIQDAIQLVNCSITGGTATGAYGLYRLSGSLVNLDSGIVADSTEAALYAAATNTGPVIITQGVNFRANVPTSYTRVYSVGALHPSAIVTAPTTITYIIDTAAAAYVQPRQSMQANAGIAWNSLSNAVEYVLYRGNSIIYRGKESFYSDSQPSFGSGIIYVYLVKAYNAAGTVIAQGTVTRSADRPNDKVVITIS